MLSWLRECIPIKEPQNGNEIRRMFIWNNIAIRVGEDSFFDRALYNKGIMLIEDLFDDKGQAYTYEQFKINHSGVQLNRLTYISWHRAIPARWKSCIANSRPLNCEEKNIKPSIVIQNQEVDITCLKSKFLRDAWLREVTPSAQIKWVNESVDFDNWGKVYSIPFNITKSTKLQNLQFRITHRFFPTKRYLCVRSVVDDPFCDHCGEIETIQHLFLECEPVRQFWNGLVERINPKLEVRQRFNINKKNVIFGSLTASPIANFIVLYAKQFIVTQRFQDREVALNKFVSSFEKNVPNRIVYCRQKRKT